MAILSVLYSYGDYPTKNLGVSRQRRSTQDRPWRDSWRVWRYFRPSISSRGLARAGGPYISVSACSRASRKLLIAPLAQLARAHIQLRSDVGERPTALNHTPGVSTGPLLCGSIWQRVFSVSEPGPKRVEWPG